MLDVSYNLTPPRAAYFGGDKVDGRVTLTVTRAPRYIRSLTVKLKGFLDVQNYHQAGRYTTCCENRIDLVSEELTLLGATLREAAAEKGQLVQMNIGVSDFDFSFELPKTLLPTLHYEDGIIAKDKAIVKYRLEVHLNTPFVTEGPEFCWTLPVVIGGYSANREAIETLLKVQTPVKSKTDKDFLFGDGVLALEGTLTKELMQKGDSATLAVKMTNTSKKQISALEVRLRSVMSIYATSLTTSHTVMKVLEYNLYRIPVTGSSDGVTQYSADIKIPSDCYCNTGAGEIHLVVSNQVEVRACVDNIFAKDLELRLPVIIVEAKPKDPKPEPIAPPRKPAMVKWIPDEDAPQCKLCKVEFGLFTRRHHCRSCGEVCCDKCSPSRPVPTTFSSHSERICNACAAKGTFNVTEPQK